MWTFHKKAGLTKLYVFVLALKKASIIICIELLAAQ